MKKFIVTFLTLILIFSMVAPGISANSKSASESDNFQNGLSEELIEKVNPYIKVDGITYELSNVDILETKISKNELTLVKEKIFEINSLLEKNENLKKTSDNTFKVEMTDRELAMEIGLNKSITKTPLVFDEGIQTYATKNGVNKVEFHWWGFEIWLSKTSVTHILTGGIATTVLVLGLLIPGVGIAVALAINGYIWSIFAGQKAQAIYFKYSYVIGIYGFKYQ